MCILQGPIAVKGSIVKDELVKDLLGNINKTMIKRLVEHKYGGDESAVPTVDYLAVAPQTTTGLSASVVRTGSPGTVTHHFGKSLPGTSAWLETLGGDKVNWIRPRYVKYHRTRDFIHRQSPPPYSRASRRAKDRRQILWVNACINYRLRSRSVIWQSYSRL